jgi:IS1 family transposase
MTLVDRRTSCIVGWAIAAERSPETVQRMVDDAPQAAFYFSDLFAAYGSVIYTPGMHIPMPDKRETYRVEGMNAELRHYLARLARQSRCFSRCIHALRRAVKLFVFA